MKSTEGLTWGLQGLLPTCLTYRVVAGSLNLSLAFWQELLSSSPRSLSVGLFKCLWQLTSYIAMTQERRKKKLYIECLLWPILRGQILTFLQRSTAFTDELYSVTVGGGIYMGRDTKRRRALGDILEGWLLQIPSSASAPQKFNEDVLPLKLLVLTGAVHRCCAWCPSWSWEFLKVGSVMAFR